VCVWRWWCVEVEVVVREIYFVKQEYTVLCCISSNEMSNFINGQFIHDDSRAADVPEHLLERNQRSTPENIALFKSAKAGSMTGVTNALGKGAKPDFFFNPEDSKNALHVAAEEGFLEIVNALIDAGAHVDCHVVGSKETAISLAAQNKHTEVVRRLIEAGANVNAGKHLVRWCLLCLSECVY
jgi:ankyrin repeat protein